MQSKIILQNGHIYTTPEVPRDHCIGGYDLPEEDQVWKRQKNVPQKIFKDLTIPERNKIIDKFWEKYFEGYWFMNNGVATYMPPAAWFFFNNWKGEFDTEDGYAQFRYEQLRQFYFQDLAENQPPTTCLGTFKFKQRQDGATIREMSTQVFKSLQAKNKWLGIISKTFEDARDVCWVMLMTGFKGLPKYVQPTQAGSSDPQKKLVYDRPSKRITRKSMMDEEDDFDSDKFYQTTLTYRATKTNSFDGKKLYHLTIDEFCKFPSDVSPAQCLSTHYRCISRGKTQNGYIHIITSPIEKMCDSFTETVDLWHDSDYENLNPETGTTNSKLWRWFSSSMTNLEGFIDKYGFCDEEAAKQKILNDRALCTSAQALRSQILQQPLYIDEIIDATNLETIFTDQEGIKNRKHYILQHPHKDENKTEPAIVYGNYVWRGGLVDTQVEWMPSQNQSDYSNTGRWKRAFDNIDPKYVNNFVIKGENKMPPKDFQFVMGIDPYEHRRVAGKKPSRGASLVMKILDYDGSRMIGVLFTQYCWRGKPEEFFEDMIKQAVYYGAKVQVEAKNMNIVNWFEDRGYWDFLMNKDLKKRDDRKGNPTTPDLIQEMSSLIDQYLSRPIIEGQQDNFQYIWFEDLLDDVLGFDPADTQKSDLTMALGQTLLGAQKLKLIKPKKYDNTNVMESIYEMFDY